MLIPMTGKWGSAVATDETSSTLGTMCTTVVSTLHVTAVSDNYLVHRITCRFLSNCPPDMTSTPIQVLHRLEDECNEFEGLHGYLHTVCTQYESVQVDMQRAKARHLGRPCFTVTL